MGFRCADLFVASDLLGGSNCLGPKGSGLISFLRALRVVEFGPASIDESVSHTFNMGSGSIRRLP